MNRNTVIIRDVKCLSFVRDVVQLNQSDRIDPTLTVLRYQYPASGTVNNGVSRRRIRTAGQPIVFVRALRVRVFVTMSINCIHILYIRDSVKFVPALPQWRSISFFFFI